MLNGRPVSEQAAGVIAATPISGDIPIDLARETLPDGASYIVQHFPQDIPNAYPSVRLGQDQWYLMGDNREDALDSRQYGPVSSSAICGVAFEYVRAHDPHLNGKKP